jgi:hypothetical protein
MRTTSYENVTFHHNGDYSGDVIIQVKTADGLVRADVPYAALRYLVAQEVLAHRISRLERSQPVDILGLR